MDDEGLNNIFSAMAHPIRREMLQRLAEGDATVNELASPFEMSLPAVSRHIRVLENAGLISRGREAQFRPCRLNPEAVRDAVAWADHLRSIWTARFETMECMLKDMNENGDGN